MSNLLPITEPHGSPTYYTSHIIRLPAIFTHTQLLILACSCAVLGLAAYSLSFNDGDHGNTWTLIIAGSTILVMPYFLVASLVDAAAPLYHRTAILILIIIGLIGWAAQFINLAFEISGAWTCYHNEYNTRICYRERGLEPKPYYREMVVEATLGGIIFGLLFVLLLAFSVLLHRARRDGRPVSYWVARERAMNALVKPTFTGEQGRKWNLQRDALTGDEEQRGVVR